MHSTLEGEFFFTWNIFVPTIHHLVIHPKVRLFRELRVYPCIRLKLLLKLGLVFDALVES